ncbi:MAG: hypothetical protein ACI8RD_010163 [Bacillariaceae sp.]|jgi:hypothetical protein
MERKWRNLLLKMNGTTWERNAFFLWNDHYDPNRIDI